MNKNLWKSAITEAHCPRWPCANCGKGVLVLKAGSLIHVATKDSFAGQDEDWWGPEQIEYSFTAWAACSNSVCNQEYAISGNGGVEQVPDEDWNSTYEDYFYVLNCTPTLQLITLPENCPAEVSKALDKAFALFWQDRSSSAGRIRVALERLLDHLSIAEQTADGKPLTLDARITTFAKNDSVNGANMMALKWLGNTGSHHADVQANDLLDAFEVVEHLLTTLLDKKSDYIASVTAALIAKHKPTRAPTQ